MLSIGDLVRGLTLLGLYPAKSSGAVTAQKTEIFDDFVDVAESMTRSISTAGLSGPNSVDASASAASNFAGVIKLNAGSTGGYHRVLTLWKDTTQVLFPANGPVEMVAKIRLTASNNNSAAWFGWVSDSPAAIGDLAFQATIHWEPSRSANWLVRTYYNVYTDTGIPASIGIHSFRLLFPDANTVQVFINGASAGSYSLNVLSSVAAIIPAIGITHAGASANDIYLLCDYLGIRQNLTTARTNFGFSS